MKNKLLRITCYVFSFFIPVLIFLFIMKNNDVVPFGNNTLAIYDLQGQYLSFISYYRTIFLSKENFLYTFSKPLGGDMVSLLTYYLFSPFNLLYLFFDNSSLPLGLSIVTLLKIGSAGLTMFIFLDYKYKNKSLGNLIFALSYALSSYMIVYHFNIMWIDAVIFLPLIILGFERIMEQKKPYLYAIFLAISIISNYYTGFMTCIFVVIFFFYRVYTKERDKIEKKNIYRLFIEGSLLAGVLSSIGWLNAIVAMSGTKTEIGNGDMTSFKLLMELPGFFNNLSGGSFTGVNEIIAGAPLIFAGCFCLYLAIMYFANKGVNKDERIGAGIIFGIFVVSFFVTAINNFWHGGAAPNWFTYRFAFLFIFFMIYIASKELNEHLETIQARDYIFVILFATIQMFFNLFNKETNMFFIELPMAIVMLGATYALVKMKKPIIQFVSLSVILGVNLLDLTISGNQNIATHTEGNSHYMSNKQYQEDLEKITPVVDYVKSYDTSGDFYRMEKTFYRSSTYNLANNDSFLFDYPGISHYSSNDKLDVRNYIGERLGFHTNNVWNSYGLGSTLSSNALMNVKYIIDEDYFYNSYLISDRRFGARDFLTPLQDVEAKNKSISGEIHIFENPYTYGMGLMVPNRSNTKGRQGEWILDEDGNVKLDENGNKMVHWFDNFEYLNWVFKDMALENKEDIFHKANVTVSYENITKIDDNHYKLTNTSQEGSITFTVDIDTNNPNPYYYFITPRQDRYFKLYDRNNRNLYYFNYYNHGMNPISKNYSQQKYRLVLKENAIYDKVTFKTDFYYEDVSVLKKYIEEFQKNSLQLKQISSSHFKGEVKYNADKPTLMFSIPYEKYWEIKINGKTVPTKIMQDIFLATQLDNLKLKDGDILKVEIIYKYNGYIYTSFLGLIGIAYIICIGYLELDKKWKKNQNKEKHS